MLDVVEDFKTDAPLQPTWQPGFREHQRRTFALSDAEDPLFIPPDTEGYLRDVPGVKLVWWTPGTPCWMRACRPSRERSAVTSRDGRVVTVRGWRPGRRLWAADPLA